MKMKKLIKCLAISLAILKLSVSAQSGAIYLTNNCTYKISDGHKITLNRDGSVLKDGKLVKGMKCVNKDGTVIIFLDRKKVDELYFQNEGKATLKDTKNRRYYLMACKP